MKICLFEKYSEKLKIGHFKMSVFENPTGLLFFYFFGKCEISICEHYGNNTEFVIFNYAVEVFGRNCSILTHDF
jgi:hypothetical protein